MIPQDKDNSPDLDYKRAEKRIKQTIAQMEDETHIEYDAPMKRNDKKSWRLIVYRLLNKLGIT